MYPLGEHSSDRDHLLSRPNGLGPEIGSEMKEEDTTTAAGAFPSNHPILMLGAGKAIAAFSYLPSVAESVQFQNPV
jgi:hypothetical protein